MAGAPRSGSAGVVYLFWHRPRAHETQSQYEAALRNFHRSLSRLPPVGLVGADSRWSSEAPWAGPALYEDAYYLDGFARLGSIVEVAYRPPWVRAHRAVARRSAFGTAALFVSRAGPFPACPPEVAAWFHSASAEDLREIQELVQDMGGCLWRRHLALGPAPEFVVRGPRTLRADRRLRSLLRSARWVRLDPISPEDAREGRGWSGRASSSRPSRTRTRSRPAP